MINKADEQFQLLSSTIVLGMKTSHELGKTNGLSNYPPTYLPTYVPPNSQRHKTNGYVCMPFTTQPNPTQPSTATMRKTIGATMP